ncbi:MAG: cadmium-translocating P-type ATPase [Candidatus Sericytochromatia bacterium]|nr:cadmium-translocating P-type ATPase [Candidatus Tanganyikabacteria bacterium]
MTERTVRLGIGGMTCASCVAAVTRTLEGTDGVLDARVDLVSHQATVRYDTDRTSPEAMAGVVRDAGFDGFAPPPGKDAPAPTQADGHDNPLGRLWLSGLLALALLLGGMPEMFAFWPASLTDGRLLASLGLVAILGPGWPIMAKAWAGLRHGRTSMETLVALGTVATWAYSTATVIAPQAFHAAGVHPHGFFDAVGLILFFVLLGRALEGRVRRDATGAARAIMAIRPETAQLVTPSGDEQRVAAASLQAGQTIRIRPGDLVPADGVLREGEGWFDEAFLTGEAQPMRRATGERVHAGSMNHHGASLVEVVKAGDQTLLARMARTLEEVMAGRTDTQRLADRVVARFVPAVLLLAALTGVAWLLLPGGGMATALVSAVAVLTVACPCALGLAVPLAVAAASGRAARAGLLVRDAAALERVRDLDMVVFDKTGTLTEGTPEVIGLHPAPGFSDHPWLALAAAAEEGSEHPLARAVVAACTKRPLPGPVTDFRGYPGDGVEAVVAGHRVMVGQPSFLAARGVEGASTATGHGEGSLIGVAVEGVFAGVLVVADRPRQQASDAVQALAGLGLEVAMVTGDRPEAAQAVASRLDIATVRAGIRPEGKVAILEAWQREGRVVAMVGDGLNDAAALAQADVGIAMGQGSAGSRAVAPVTLLEPDLMRLAALVRLGRRTRSVMVQNLGWTLGYNVVMLPLAAGMLRPWGWWLDPMWAAAAMATSSLTVVLNAARLTRMNLKA